MNLKNEATYKTYKLTSLFWGFLLWDIPINSVPDRFNDRLKQEREIGLFFEMKQKSRILFCRLKPKIPPGTRVPRSGYDTAAKANCDHSRQTS